LTRLVYKKESLKNRNKKRATGKISANEKQGWVSSGGVEVVFDKGDGSELLAEFIYDNNGLHQSFLF
jgi:hypothetical protein